MIALQANVAKLDCVGAQVQEFNMREVRGDARIIPDLKRSKEREGESEEAGDKDKV